MSVAAAASTHGELAGGNLEPVLERLRFEQATGILTVQNDDDIIAISFDGGLIVGADALNEPREAGLGRALMKEGLLSREQFSRAVDRIRGERGRLGEILLEETGLSRADYLAALRRYTVALVDRSCSWRRGEFRFFAGDEVLREDDFEPIAFGSMEPGIEEPADAPLESPGAMRHLQGRSSDQPDEIAEGPAVDSAYGAQESRRTVVRGIEPAVEPSIELPIDLSMEYEVPRTGLRERIADWIGRAPQWIGWALPALATVLLLLVVLWRPDLLVYPVFWLEPERLAFEQQRRASVYLKIDRAARTFFLLEGRFPDDLHTLVARGLLRPADIVGSRGHLLNYLPGDRGYVIRSAVKDGTDAGVTAPEAIAGDFFLDPEYVVLAPETDTPPLVLLD